MDWQKITFFFTIFIQITKGQFRTDYMTINCNRNFVNQIGGRIEAGYEIRYENNMNCTYTIHAGQNKFLLLLLKRFRLENKIAGICVDYVDFYDGQDSSAAKLNSEPLCGQQVIHNFTTSGEYVTIHFVTDHSAVFRGFEIIYSSFTRAPCDSELQFRCDDGLCVDVSMKCDEVAQCGDESDESYNTCYVASLNDNKLDAGMLAGVIIGGIVFIIILSVVTYKAVDYYRWQQFLKENHLNRYPWEKEEDIYQYPVTDRYAKEKNGKRGRRTSLVTPEPAPVLGIDPSNLSRVSSIISTSSFGSITKKPLDDSTDEKLNHTELVSDNNNDNAADSGIINDQQKFNGES